MVNKKIIGSIVISAFFLGSVYYLYIEGYLNFDRNPDSADNRIKMQNSISVRDKGVQLVFPEVKSKTGQDTILELDPTLSFLVPDWSQRVFLENIIYRDGSVGYELNYYVTQEQRLRTLNSLKTLSKNNQFELLYEVTHGSDPGGFDLLEYESNEYQFRVIAPMPPKSYSTLKFTIQILKK